eukprot:365692-Chlamydomonas_euryale.AAC.4
MALPACLPSRAAVNAHHIPDANIPHRLPPPTSAPTPTPAAAAAARAYPTPQAPSTPHFGPFHPRPAVHTRAPTSSCAHRRTHNSGRTPPA